MGMERRITRRGATHEDHISARLVVPSRQARHHHCSMEKIVCVTRSLTSNSMLCIQRHEAVDCYGRFRIHSNFIVIHSSHILRRLQLITLPLDHRTQIPNRQRERPVHGFEEHTEPLAHTHHKSALPLISTLGSDASKTHQIPSNHTSHKRKRRPHHPALRRRSHPSSRVEVCGC